MDVQNFAISSSLEVGAAIVLGHLSKTIIDPMIVPRDHALSDILGILAKSAIYTYSYRMMIPNVASQDGFLLYAIPYFAISGMTNDVQRLKSRFW